MIAAKMQKAGFRLIAEGDQLRVEPPDGKRLTDDQRLFIKQHKAEILAELKASNESSPVNRLRTLAPKYRLDPDDLLNWYRNDLDMIGGMDNNTLNALVRDYAANRETFQGRTPYQPYRLWLYRLQSDSDQLRQGLMTDDPEEAQRRLAAIYGKPVADLHKLVPGVPTVNGMGGGV